MTEFPGTNNRLGGPNMASTRPRTAWQRIKEPYGPPYIVQWQEPQQREGWWWSLTGHFQAVPGYSTAHTATWDLYPYTVDGEDDD